AASHLPRKRGRIIQPSLSTPSLFRFRRPFRLAASAFALRATTDRSSYGGQDAAPLPSRRSAASHLPRTLGRIIQPSLSTPSLFRFRRPFRLAASAFALRSTADRSSYGGPDAPPLPLPRCAASHLPRKRGRIIQPSLLTPSLFRFR